MLRGDSLMKALRKGKVTTQMQVSARTGLAQGYISDIESRRTGTPETLNLIADALEIDRKWLLPDSTP